MLKQSNIPTSFDHVSSVCKSCLEGKFAKLLFVFLANKTVQPLEVIHSDVCEPSSTVFIEGYKFYVSFVDKCTRFTWIFPLINKSEVFSVFVNFHSFLILNFLPMWKSFKVMVGVNTPVTNSNNTYYKRVSFIKNHVPTLVNKTASLKGSIATYLKQPLPYFKQQIFHINFGSMLVQFLFIS